MAAFSLVLRETDLFFLSRFGTVWMREKINARYVIILSLQPCFGLFFNVM